MRTRPASWAAIFDGPHMVEYRYTINGLSYTGSDIQGTPMIERPLMTAPVVGRCCSGTLSINVRQRAGTPIPKAAAVVVQCRLAATDSALVTGWVDLGHYWISSRSGHGEVTLFNCRDGMMMAGQTYADKTRFSEWPITMSQAVNEIASIMGVEVDPRTIIRSGVDYVVGYPSDDTIMTEILQSIAAAHAANWIMTPEGKLLLLPYPDTSETPAQVIDTRYSSYVPLSNEAKTISRITLTDSAENQYTAGTDDGVEIAVNCEYATQDIVDAMAVGYYVKRNTFHAPSGSVSRHTFHAVDGVVQRNGLILPESGLLGRAYIPYQLEGAYIDPLVELGDTVRIKTRKGAVLDLVANTITIKLTPYFTANLANGVEDDDEDECPYTSVSDLQQKRFVTTGKTYFGNKIDRVNGFTSEQVVDGVAVARTVANANRFAMQRYVDGQWEDCIYFDPVNRTYHLSGSVKMDSGVESLSGVMLSCNSISVASTKTGNVIGNHTITCRVIAYTGNNKVIPHVETVAGQPQDMPVVIQESPVDDEKIITITIPAGATLGSADSCDGTLKVYVSYPVQTVLDITWCKINTGADGQTIPGEDGLNSATVNLYKRASSTPSKPGACTYTFATGAVTGTLNGWSKSIPSGTDSCYVVTAVAVSKLASVGIAASAWTSPVVFVSNGTNGLPGRDGANGQDGRTSYFHVKYAHNGSPEDSEMLDTPAEYIGTYVDFAQLPSTRADDYTWTRFQGADGKNGTNGTPGTNGEDGRTSYFHVKYSNDGGKTFTDDQGETPGEYIGTYADFTQADSTNVNSYKWQLMKGADGRDGVDGKDGKDGTSVTILGSYDTEAELKAAHPTASMGDSYIVAGNLYVWVGSWKNVGTIQGPAGADGKDGKDGTNGTNGTSRYIHIRYAKDSTGTGMSPTPADDSQYIGIAVTTSSTAPTGAGSYTWSKYAGSDGVNGVDGASIWTTTTAPVTPNYTFTISNLNGPTGNTPKVGDIIVYSYYRYTVTSVAATTVQAGSRVSIRGATGATGAQGAPGNDGEDGLNSAMIYLYMRAPATPAPATPSKTAVFTFSTASITGDLDGWTQTIPSTDGNPCWVTTACISARTATADVAASVWASPAIIVEDGERGSYTFQQDEEPENGQEGDMWIDTDDDGKLYYHNGTEWVVIENLNIPGITNRLIAAETAFNTYKDKIEASVTATTMNERADEIIAQCKSLVEQSAREITTTFEGRIETVDGKTTSYQTLIRASGDGVEIGKSGSDISILIENDKITFRQRSGSAYIPVAYISNNMLYITDARVTHELSFGEPNKNGFVWTKTSNGLSLRYVSGV